jgi:hypothetical protein
MRAIQTIGYSDQSLLARSYAEGHSLNVALEMFPAKATDESYSVDAIIRVQVTHKESGETIGNVTLETLEIPRVTNSYSSDSLRSIAERVDAYRSLIQAAQRMADYSARATEERIQKAEEKIESDTLESLLA